MNVPIGSSDTNTKCVQTAVSLTCAANAGDRDNRVNDHNADDRFEITTNGQEVCARRIDDPNAGWGMNLEISCAANYVTVNIGPNVVHAGGHRLSKCVRVDVPVACHPNAGNPGFRLNNDGGSEEFAISSGHNWREGHVCAERTDTFPPQPWDQDLTIFCNQDVEFINILIDSSDTNVKQVDNPYPYPVVCAPDAGNLGNRVNTNEAEDQFEIWTDRRRVFARRLDSSGGWGMHLEIECMARPISVLIGGSDTNTKCVTPETRTRCCNDAGDLGFRVNTDEAGDTFEITSEWPNPQNVQVCARRTDSDGGWGMPLEIMCMELP